MKKLILLTLMIVALSAMFAIKFDPDYFVSRSVIVCFTKDAVGNDTGKIDYTLQNGYVRTGISPSTNWPLSFTSWTSSRCIPM